jgi:hypothetical protein
MCAPQGLEDFAKSILNIVFGMQYLKMTGQDFKCAVVIMGILFLLKILSTTFQNLHEKTHCHLTLE